MMVASTVYRCKDDMRPISEFWPNFLVARFVCVNIRDQCTECIRGFVFYLLNIFIYSLSTVLNSFRLISNLNFWPFCWSLDILEIVRANFNVALRTRYCWYWELGQVSLLLTYIILKYERSSPRVDYLNWAGIRMVLCPLHYTVHSTVHSVPCSGLGHTHSGLLSSGQ